jgi:hypothetical protein
MPTFRRVTTMTANGTATPLQDAAWTYRRLPFAAAVQVWQKSTDANVVAQIVIGSDEVQQESPVGGGGTAGTFPDQLPLLDTYYGQQGDEIRIGLRETAGGTPSVNTLVIITPI